MPSGRDSFRRNRVAPTGTTPIIPLREPLDSTRLKSALTTSQPTPSQIPHGRAPLLTSLHARLSPLQAVRNRIPCGHRAFGPGNIRLRVLAKPFSESGQPNLRFARSSALPRRQNGALVGALDEHHEKSEKRYSLLDTRYHSMVGGSSAGALLDVSKGAFEVTRHTSLLRKHCSKIRLAGWSSPNPE